MGNPDQSLPTNSFKYKISKANFPLLAAKAKQNRSRKQPANTNKLNKKASP